MKYFAYGSNLNRDNLIEWCKNHRQKIPKMLNPRIKKVEGYTIGFTRYSYNRKGGVADIISPGDFCYGIVFDVTEEDLKVIDKKEGVKENDSGAYKRLDLPEGMITYEVVKKESDFVQPNDKYVDAIIQGAKNYGIPQEWINKLESFKEISKI